MKLLAAIITIVMPDLKAENVLPVLLLASNTVALIIMNAKKLTNALTKNIKAGCIEMNEIPSGHKGRQFNFCN